VNARSVLPEPLATAGPARNIAIAVGVLMGWPLMAGLLPNGAPVAVVLLGAVLGTVTALLAMGLILLYRSTRIVNFAYGAMGGVAGVFAVNLFLTWNWNFYLAMTIGLLMGVAVGALTEIVVIRRFTNSSRLVLTVATIGLTQVLGGFQLLIPIWMDGPLLLGGYDTPINVSINIGPVLFTGAHVLIVACVPVVIAGLAYFLVRTDAGVAVRAAAENSDRALLLGIPIRRLSTMVWALAGGLSALTFMLRAPFQGVTSDALSGLTPLLPALAAAVVARMESLPKAVAAGVGLGVLEQVVLWNSDKASTVDVAFLIVILVALLAQRHQLSRGQDSGASSWSTIGVLRPIPRELRGLREVVAARWGLLAVVTAAALAIPHLYPDSLFLITVALVWGIVAVSLVILTGWGGHISLGHFAIVGAGAVVAGNLIVRWNVDFFVTLAIAGLAGGLVALLVGLPALRIKGLFLAVTTLAFAVALDSFFLNPVNFPSLIPSGVTRPHLWGSVDLEDGVTAYYVALAVLVAALLAASGIRASRAGRVLLATRDNERAADAMAVPTTATKIGGFMLAGVFAGVAGGIHVVLLHGAGSGTYQPAQSIEVFSMAVIGGLGSLGGALSGVFLLRWLEQVIDPAYRLLVTGTGLLVILYALPGGLGQAAHWVRDRWLRWVAKRHDILVPSLVADRRTEDKPADETDTIAGALNAPADIRDPVDDDESSDADGSVPGGGGSAGESVGADR